jgi:hypothetical protein
LACRSELPPMCFCPMKMLGTVLCDVMDARALWMAGPSASWSSSTAWNVAPSSVSRRLAVVQ